MTDQSVIDDISKLISDNFDTKRDRDSKNENILALFRDGFETVLPSGPRFINSTMLQQIMWRIMDKTKPLDFQLHGNGAPAEMEDLMTYGLGTVAKKSGLTRNLSTKQGLFNTSYLLGDAFHMWGTQENNKIPIVNSMIPNSNLYVDQYATAFRAANGRNVTKALAIFSMSPTQAKGMFPKLKSMPEVCGQIPREINRIANVETGRGYLQTWKIQSDLIELGYWFNIENPKKPIFAVIAGNQMKVLEKLSKDKYPFMMDGEPYIPISQQMCMPSAQGFYNYGVGDLFYRYANVSRQLLNLAMGHAFEFTYPTTLVNVAMGKANDFFASLQASDQARAQGRRPIVPIEYDPSNPGASRIAAESLMTNGAMAEFQIMRDMIDKDIRRLGINLDDADVNPNATQYQILAEEQKQTAWVSQVQEYNAEETEHNLSVLLDMSKKFIKKSNKTQLDIPVNLEIEGVKVKDMGLTLGAWADELRKRNYFIRVDSRTGAIPSNVAKQTKLQRSMALLPPGSPQQMKLAQQLLSLNDVKIDMSALQQQQPPSPEGAPPMPGAQPQQNQLALTQ